MRRTIVAIAAVAAVLFTACSGVQAPATGSTRPVAFPTTSQAPAPGETPVEAVVQEVLPAVVNVVTNQGEGTGFVVRQDGVIVTNAHVVEGASSLKVLTSAKDPQTYQARVIGGDVEADLAVLKVDATGLPTVPMGSSEDLQLGQTVVAIGYALGLQGGPSVTSGIVSSLNRQITVNDPNFGQRTYSEVIQTDAAINPGNSGGPLVDLAGNVVGINTAGTTQAENVGFAIKIDSAKPVILHAAEDPNAPVAYLGVSSTDADNPQFQFQFDSQVGQGAGIVDVVQGGPAAQAGIEPGDVVVSLGGRDVASSEQLGEAIRAHRPGDRVDVEIVHPDGSRETVTATLGTNPVPLS